MSAVSFSWHRGRRGAWARGTALLSALLALAVKPGAAADVTAPTPPATAPTTITEVLALDSDGGSLHGFLAPDDPGRYAVTDATPVLSQDAIYARPFLLSLSSERTRTAVGGYLEMNAGYAVADGASDGFGFEFRRFNLFVYSAIASRLKFLAELEFEHGVEEIALEQAQIDIVLDPAAIIRAGIILPPLGRFNVTHDSPRYEFVERPLVSTDLIPATLSEVGAGLYGKLFPGRLTLTYDAYVVNGLGEGVVLNDQARTLLAAGRSPAAFEEDNNGRPSFVGRLSLAHDDIGELGVSSYGGTYNSYRIEGEAIAPKRQLYVVAGDWDLRLGELNIQGEAAWADIELDPGLRELFAGRQRGFYTDLVYPIWTFAWLRETDSVINAAVRVDRLDRHVGEFTTGAASGHKIYDEDTALTLGLALRPVPDTTIRLNFRQDWTRDILGNPAAITRGIHLGLASYF